MLYLSPRGVLLREGCVCTRMYVQKGTCMANGTDSASLSRIQQRVVGPVANWKAQCC